MSQPIVGQDVDYYKNLAQNESNIPKKLTAIDSIISKSQAQNKDVYLDYSLQYIDLTIEIDSVAMAARKAIELQQSFLNRKDKSSKILLYLNKVLAYKHKLKDSTLTGSLYLSKARLHAKNNYNNAIKDATEAIKNYKSSDYKNLANAYFFLGKLYNSEGKTENASDSFNKAYELYKKEDNEEYMFRSKHLAATVFSDVNLFEKAIAKRIDLVNKMEYFDNKEFISLEHYHLALDYENMGNIPKMIYHLNIADQELKKESTSSLNTLSQILVNSKFATFYIENNAITKSKTHIKTLDSLISNAEGSVYLAPYYLTKSKYYRATNNIDNALIAANKKLTYCTSLDAKTGMIEAHELLSVLYEEKKNYKNALYHKKEAENIEEVIDKEKPNSIDYYQKLYETEKQEKNLLKTTAEVRLLEKDNETLKKLIAITILGILLLFGLFLLFKNQRELQKNKKRQERFSQKLIVSQEGERMRISKDLHDSLGQQLLLIKNKLIYTKDEEVKNMVDSAIDEVRTISKDLHPFQLQEMGITRAIEHTLTKIDENTPIFISSEIDNIDNLFEKDKEVNVFRIVQETLNNVIKHSKAEACKLTVKKLPKNVIIAVQDNGMGFEFSEKYRDVKSLGLKTLFERTKVLDGQVKVTSKKNNGTLIEFQFPVT